jgi:hypothetical protein
MWALGVDSEGVRVWKVREKRRYDQEVRVQLLLEAAKKLRKELKECEADERRLETLAEDLMSAMRWAQSESHGLDRASVTTAPVMLLMFQQFCRQEISAQRLKNRELGELFVTADRLRRWCGCTGADLRKAGYNAQEALRGGYSVCELQEATVLLL